MGQIMHDDPLSVLEDLLSRRQRLWERSIYYWGASERSPSYGPQDQAEWDQVIKDLHDVEQALAAHAHVLRTRHAGLFAQWVAERRLQHERRLTAPDVKRWEVESLSGTIARWERFLLENYSDFYLWMSW